MKYARPAGAGQVDFAAARAYELQVGELLGPYLVANLDSPDRMDYWIPQVFVDVKERRQPLSNKWPVPADWNRDDVMVIDELSLRRAVQHGSASYFWLRDCTFDRVFLARVDEILCAPRVRIDRETSPGKSKGKHLVRLTDFREITNRLDEVLAIILEDQIAMPWKQSPLLVEGDI